MLSTKTKRRDRDSNLGSRSYMGNADLDITSQTHNGLMSPTSLENGKVKVIYIPEWKFQTYSCQTWVYPGCHLKDDT